MKKKDGFTLLEVVCAVSIMMILAGVMFPQGVRYINRARETKEKNWARGLWQTMQIYMVEEHEGQYIAGYELMDELEDTSIPAVREIVQPYFKKGNAHEFHLQNINVSKTTYEITQIKYETEQWNVTMTKDSVVLASK